MSYTAAKHTPGPWTAKMSKYRDGVMIVQAGMPSNRVLAQFGHEDELDETDLADARLISAAPDLLAALKDIAFKRKAGATPKMVPGSLIEEIETIALAAIAIATHSGNHGT